MPLMSKERKTKAVTTQKPQRTGVSFNVYLPVELRKALDDYVDSTRPRTTAKATVETALEDFLSKVGFWPPKD